MRVRPWWQHGELSDLQCALVRPGEQIGLVLFGGTVALRCGLREGRLVPRAVVAHEAVLIFSQAG
ncbi:MAG: hypothetical protein ACYDB7_00790 [Mycobacteriales bacterium]